MWTTLHVRRLQTVQVKYIHCITKWTGMNVIQNQDIMQDLKAGTLQDIWSD
jgi:hypothetical protein